MTQYSIRAACRIPVLLAALAICIGALNACAARGDIEQSALVVGELALAVDQQERNAYAAKLYDDVKHKELGELVLRVLYAARGYERAVAEGRDLATARSALLTALSDAERAAQGFDRIVSAIGAVRTALGGA